MITIQSKSTPFVSKVNLYKKRELLPEPKLIFTRWFETFSEDGLMSPKNCVDFIKSTTNDSSATESDRRVVKLFEEFSKEQEGYLTLNEFLNFYRETAI